MSSHATADAEAGPKAIAVLVVHGMGQQMPFETLDSVTRGLDRVATADGYRTSTSVARVDLGARRVGRVEMTLWKPGSDPTHVHLYEAYWAPLTEGQIGLGGVMAFLWRAGINGTWNHVRQFERWIFDRCERYEPPVRTLIFTLVALAVVASLVVMNGAIAAVAAATALYGERSAWLSDGLYADFTAVFTWVLAAGVAFVIALSINDWRWGRTGARVAGVVAVALFGLLAVVVVGAGVALPLLTLHHVRAGGDGPPPARLVPGAGSNVGPLVASVSVAVVILGLLVYLGIVIVRRTIREWRAKRGGAADTRIGWFSPLVTAAFVGLVVLLALELVYFVRHLGQGQRNLGSPAILWLLLIAASAYVRQLLVEYPGDVAIYVQPQVLDRFLEVREKIKASVGGLARAIYDAGATGAGLRYDGVVIAGHSLGSIVAYDVLNQLIADDTTPPAPASRNVVGRTRLLLTFGSPLDKTAFFFTKQQKRFSGAVWAALSTSFQPLIEDRATRLFRWINVYSRWDVVSGALDYYDTLADQAQPDDAKPIGAVRNHLDRDATTFLAAHVEYWRGTTIYAAMLAGIDGGRFPRS